MDYWLLALAILIAAKMLATAIEEATFDFLERLDRYQDQIAALLEEEEDD